MSKGKTISVSREAYERIERAAEARGIAVSSLVDLAVAPAIGLEAAPVVPFYRRRRRNRAA